MERSVPSVLLVLLAVLLLPVLSAGAQSNEILDAVLAEEQLTYGSAAWLLLLANSSVTEETTRTEAVAAIARAGIGLPDRAANETVTLGEYALLAMRVFEIDGGFAYRILPSPRYATRELVFLKIIQGHDYPGMSLSGERGMRILGRVLGLRERGLL